ncbi:hypothetical protein RQ831_18250 [Roseomonas gilardii]|uniref:Pectate lyase superfamily protein domain-containing protein n=1 Tax=Roseomonas gilardii TaxID=257708 RepID=A0ABU3MJ62_9PROT|nr:hypothetical protein [Roseomonas gilardii]MDT8332998.1 hypothetical protein [Roseomonas gilardii]
MTIAAGQRATAKDVLDAIAVAGGISLTTATGGDIDRTGAIDAGPAIQRAIDRAISVGNPRINLGAGTLRIETPVFQSAPLDVLGLGCGETASGAPATIIRNACGAGVSMWTVSGTNGRGSSFSEFAVVEDHPPPLSGWTPAANGWVFDIQDCQGGVRFDVHMPGVNKGIRCTNSGRVMIDRLRGQFFNTALELDKAYDNSTVGHFHAWPFYSSHDNIMAYQQANSVGIRLKRADGVMMGSVFAFGCLSAVELAQGADGAATKVFFDAIYTDLCKYGVHVMPGTDGAFVLISQATMQGQAWGTAGVPIAGAKALMIEGNNSRVCYDVLQAERFPAGIVAMTGAGNKIDGDRTLTKWVNESGGTNTPLFAMGAGAGNEVSLSQPPRIENTASVVLSSGGTAQIGARVLVPAGSTDFPLDYASQEGGQITRRANGSGNNVGLMQMAKGTARSSLGAREKRIFSVDDFNGTGDTEMLLRTAAGGMNFVVESTATNAGAAFAPKGAGRLSFTNPSFPALPTSASGLPSGALWCDTASGNAIKVVP